MKKFFFLTVLLSLFFSHEVIALKTDGKAEALFRSFPRGIYMKAEAGASQIFWGEKSQGNPLYGHIRFSGEIKNSLSINSGTATLEVFPISFFGIYAGQTLMKRNYKKFHTFNCDQYVCDSQKLHRSFFGIKTALKFKSIFLTENVKWTHTRTRDRTDKIFIDEQGSLLGAQGGDTLQEWVQLLGFEINESYKAGILTKFNQMDQLKNTSSMQALILIHNWGDHQLGIALGNYHTRNDTNHFTTLINYQWSPEKGNQLF